MDVNINGDSSEINNIIDSDIGDGVVHVPHGHLF